MTVEITNAGATVESANEQDAAAERLGLGAEDTSLSEDDIFHLLQNERRRQVLRYLDQTEGTVEMRDIAEQVAAWEHDTTLRALSSDERQRVYIALYQAHLPKLDDAGVIEYNQDRGYVTPTDRLDDLTTYVDLLNRDDEQESPPLTDWSQYYLGASGVGAALVALSVLGVSVFAGLSGVVLAIVVVTMFSVLSIGQLSERYQLATDV